MHKHRKALLNKGFSLAELLACVVIMGILTSFCFPIYKKHIDRARIMEGLSLVEPVKLKVQEAALLLGFSPIKNNASIGLPPPESFSGNSVLKINVLGGGKVQISYKNPEGSLTLTPTESFGILRWSCQSNTESFNEILPSHCTGFKKS